MSSDKFLQMISIILNESSVEIQIKATRHDQIINQFIRKMELFIPFEINEPNDFQFICSTVTDTYLFGHPLTYKDDTTPLSFNKL